MSQELVRVQIDNTETNVGKAFAEKRGLTVLDEPVANPDGTLRPPTRLGGRPSKPRTSVAKEAAKKKAAPSADTDNPPSEGASE